MNSNNSNLQVNQMGKLLQIIWNQNNKVFFFLDQ